MSYQSNKQRMEEISTGGIGIIGFGSIARLHAQVLQELVPETGAPLIAIADPKTTHPDNGIRSFSNYHELLALGNVSSVIVATPPSSHFQIASDALLAGKNVFLEKPPTLTVSELQHLEQLAKRRKKVLFSGFHTRYRPEMRKAKEVLRDEEILDIAVDYKEDVVRWHGPGAWVFDPAIAGGGILIDSGINVVSALTYIIPDVDYAISSCGRQFANGSRVETSVKVLFELVNRSGKKGRGLIQMDGLYKGEEVRRLNLKTAAHEYQIDVVQSRLMRDGAILSGDAGAVRKEADIRIEYLALFRDFFDHLNERKSFVSARELQFVLDAYKLSDDMAE